MRILWHRTLAAEVSSMCTAYEGWQAACYPVPSSLFNQNTRFDSGSSAGKLEFQVVFPGRDTEIHIKVQLANTRCNVRKTTIPVKSFPQGTPMKICSWCQAIFDEKHNTWLPYEQAPSRLLRLHGKPPPTFSHGCCPTCFNLIRGKTNEYSCGG